VYLDSSYASARLVLITFIAFLFSAVAGVPRDQPSVQVCVNPKPSTVN
jgi:hypothetical protein